jgi:hypothetical protein
MGVLAIDCLFPITAAWDVDGDNASGMPVAARQERGCPLTQIPIIHSGVSNTGGKLPHSQLKGTPKLPQSKGLIRIECHNCVQVIFRVE